MKNSTRNREGIHGYCHTCPYDGKRDPICIICAYDPENPTKHENEGINGGLVHLDAYEDCELEEKKIKTAADYMPCGSPCCASISGVPGNALDIMLFMLTEISMIDDDDAPLMVKLIGGKSQEDICRELRITCEYLRRRSAEVLGKYPVCAAYVRRIALDQGEVGAAN